MRIRTIKPEFFLHETLFEAEKRSSLPLRIAFIGLWCVADREGRFKWEPRKLGVQVMPYDSVDFSAILHALAEAGLVVRYGDAGEFGYIPTFLKHQCINAREAKSMLPEPPEVQACASMCKHVTAHGEGKGREGNKEGEQVVLDWNPTEKQKGVARWLGRKITTKWSDKELRLWRAFTPDEDELRILDALYTLKAQPQDNNFYRRKDVETFLNNWRGEIDRARHLFAERPELIPSYAIEALQAGQDEQLDP